MENSANTNPVATTKKLLAFFAIIFSSFKHLNLSFNILTMAGDGSSL